MLKIIAATGIAAAFALTVASAASARDYDDILKDRGIYVYENGSPFPYSEYQTQVRAHETHVQALNARSRAARAQAEAVESESPDRW
jgi:hypothetical protein